MSFLACHAVSLLLCYGELYTSYLLWKQYLRFCTSWEFIYSMRTFLGSHLYTEVSGIFGIITGIQSSGQLDISHDVHLKWCRGSALWFLTYNLENFRARVQSAAVVILVISLGGCQFIEFYISSIGSA